MSPVVVHEASTMTDLLNYDWFAEYWLEQALPYGALWLNSLQYKSVS